MSSVLGRTTTGTLELPEALPAPTSKLPTMLNITMTSDEVVSNCPVTGQPDFYTISIDFSPNGYIIESKSLKLYLRKFAEIGIFGEQLAVTIRDDINEVIHPSSLSVTVTQKSRGGITITTWSSLP